MSGNLFDHYGVPGEAGATSRVGEPLVSNIFGAVMRKSAGAVPTAGRAGVEANDMLPADRGGLAPIEDVQGMAASALDKARQEALAAYSSDAASVAADKRPFDFQSIEAALPDPATARTFDGIHLTDIPRLRTRLDEIIGKVKASDPAAQTPQRMDELKRAVAALREWNLPRSPERAAVDRVHAAIEAEIADKAPNYAKAMADHWKAADQLNRAGHWVTVFDPLGRQINARYGWIEKGKLAVMEMSEAAGMRRLSEDERDPLRTNTFGVGEMLLDSAQRGVDKIIIGLGGSATNDGGFGMAQALGFQFFGENDYEQEHELKSAISELRKLKRIQKPRNLSLPKIVAAVDVRNPLLGRNGATHIFGPQKGASEDKIDILERALTKLADVVSKDLEIDYREERGAGAAGGLGFGLMSFCGAIVRPGFDVVAETIDLESKIKRVDVVITGEGSLDRQTLEGKAPAGVAQLAKKFGKRVFAIVGRASDDREVRDLFDGVYELSGSISEARELLRQKARESAEKLL